MGHTETGDAIVDWYMDIAKNMALGPDVRAEARRKLREFALRQTDQTVEDIDGPSHRYSDML